MFSQTEREVLAAVASGASTHSALVRALAHRNPRSVERARHALVAGKALSREGEGRKTTYRVLVAPPAYTGGPTPGMTPGGTRGADRGLGGKGGDPVTSLVGRTISLEAAAKQLAAASKNGVTETPGAPPAGPPVCTPGHAALDVIRDLVELVRAQAKDLAELRARLEPKPYLPAELVPLLAPLHRDVKPANVRAAFNGDEAPQIGDKPPELHSRVPRAPSPDPDAAEKDETCTRFVALLVQEGRSAQEAEAMAMKWRSHPRLKLAVATVLLQRARGGTIEAPSRFVPWLCKHDEELPAEGVAANWGEIDKLVATAVPRKPRRKDEPQADEAEAKPTKPIDIVAIDKRAKEAFYRDLLEGCETLEQRKARLAGGVA